jgi:hypothetical protein
MNYKNILYMANSSITVCIYIAYGALHNKKPLLFRGEISYPDVSNDQSKLLNNFFISKSYRILNFMIFLSFLTIFKNSSEIDYFLMLNRNIFKNNLKNS